MCIQCGSLIKAIDAFITKADDKLVDKLRKEGYIEAEATVEDAEKLEDDIAEAIEGDAEALAQIIEDNSDNTDSEEFYNTQWLQIKSDMESGTAISTAIAERFRELIPKLTELYLQQTDKELMLNRVTRRTSDWIENWSGELGELMELENADELEKILLRGIDEGLSVEKVSRMIQEAGIRDVRYKARRTALTEMLRSHSAAAHEAITQSPVVDRKCWRHTGGGKNPRPGHLVLDGTIIAKDESFDVSGPDGRFKEKYPRDSALPVSEAVNCHCLLQAVVSDKALGMPLEERWEMQSKAIEADDTAWERETDEKKREKAVQWRQEHGLYVPTNDGKSQINYIKSKSKQGQINHLGTKSRWALVESGVISDDEALARIYKTETLKNGKTVTRRKTLTELKDGGIITIDNKALKHSTVGEFSGVKNPKKPPGGLNGGKKMISGGHSQSNIDELLKRDIDYRIEFTYENGVRIGGVKVHDNPNKRIGTVGQSWFPSDWTDDDILTAGTYVANSVKLKPNNVVFGEYNGVCIGVFADENGKPVSFFPDNAKQPKLDASGYEEVNIDEYRNNNE